MSTATALVRFSGTTPQAATDDVCVGRVRMFDTRAWVAYRRNDDEWRRRSGCSPILALDVLDALMSLPAGLPVPVAAVAPTDRRLFRGLPPGSVDVSGGTITRRVVPAAMPVLAMVRSAAWLEGLEAASRFAAYCRRLVIVSALPDEREAALAEAAFYGIGVAVATGKGHPRVMLEPEPLADWQPTPAWWWFAEEIYRQVHTQP